MEEEKKILDTRKSYTTPYLIVHGDVENITLGTELGVQLDGAFPTTTNPRGNKLPPRENAFS